MNRQPYQKVLDGRKQPIRGLWRRNNLFYARLTVREDDTGRRGGRIALPGGGNGPSSAKRLRQLLAKRDNNNLPVLKQSPKLSDYVSEYFSYYVTVRDAKRPVTLAKESGALRLWVAHRIFQCVVEKGRRVTRILHAGRNER